MAVPPLLFCWSCCCVAFCALVGPPLQLGFLLCAAAGLLRCVGAVRAGFGFPALGIFGKTVVVMYSLDTMGLLFVPDIGAVEACDRLPSGIFGILG